MIEIATAFFLRPPPTILVSVFALYGFVNLSCHMSRLIKQYIERRGKVN